MSKFDMLLSYRYIIYYQYITLIFNEISQNIEFISGRSRSNINFLGYSLVVLMWKPQQNGSGKTLKLYIIHVKVSHEPIIDKFEPENCQLIMIQGVFCDGLH